MRTIMLTALTTTHCQEDVFFSRHGFYGGKQRRIKEMLGLADRRDIPLNNGRFRTS